LPAAGGLASPPEAGKPAGWLLIAEVSLKCFTMVGAMNSCRPACRIPIYREQAGFGVLSYQDTLILMRATTLE